MNQSTTDSRAARATIGAMKGGSAPSITVGHPTVAIVRPVVADRSGSLGADARLITKWRNVHRSAFLTEFRAEPERTETWLRNVVGPDQGRLLFMLEDPGGRVFGHLGLAGIDLERHRAELDSVVRGEPTVRGIMAACVAAVARWASTELGTRHLFLRVRSDNPAVGFYERIGFTRTGRVPLRLVRDGIGVRWVEDPDVASAIDVIYMDYQWPAAEDERIGRS